MAIKSWNQLKKEKLKLKYELELAKLEAKSAGLKLDKYRKPITVVESLLESIPIKNSALISTVAGLALKVFFKKK